MPSIGNVKIVNSPLVRAYAFVGLEQYQERCRKMAADAIELTKKRQIEHDDLDRSPIKKPRIIMSNPEISSTSSSMQQATTKKSSHLTTKSTTGVQFTVGGLDGTVRCNVELNALPKKRKSFDERELLNIAMWEDCSAAPASKRQKLDFDADLSTENDADWSMETTLQNLRSNSVIKLNLLAKNSKKLNGRGLLNRRSIKMANRESSPLARKKSVFGIASEISEIVERRNQQSEKKVKLTTTTGDEPSPLVRCNAVIGMGLLGNINPDRDESFDSDEYFRRTIRQNKNAFKTTDQDKPSSHSSPLVRSNAVIGMGLLGNIGPDRDESFDSDEYFRRTIRQNKNAFKTTDQDKSPSHSSPLVRCNAVIGMGLLGNMGPVPKETVENYENSTPLVRSNAVIGMGLLGETTANTSVSAKPKQVKKSMSLDQLLRKEAAVQRWNAKYGTNYSIL